MRISVVIPTYMRPSALEQCVLSLRGLDVKPDEIVIAGRKGDSETAKMIHDLQSEPSTGPRLRDVWVSIPGHIPPVCEAMQAATGEIVAIVDDDVTVPREWLGLLVANFEADSRVAVVGGRVSVPDQLPPPLKGLPGRLTWYGRLWANLGNLPGSEPIDVVAVQECNWAWRKSVVQTLEFDMILNFDDASMYGLDWCLQAQALGYRVVYDPRAAVWHHTAPRAPELDRADSVRRAISYCRNYTYIMMKHLPVWQQLAFLAWWLLIGERGGWGLAVAAADAVVNRRLNRREEIAASLRAKMTGIRLAVARRTGSGMSSP